jgi:hypothetical protein
LFDKNLIERAFAATHCSEWTRGLGRLSQHARSYLSRIFSFFFYRLPLSPLRFSVSPFLLNVVGLLFPSKMERWQWGEHNAGNGESTRFPPPFSLSSHVLPLDLLAQITSNRPFSENAQHFYFLSTKLADLSNMKARDV